MEPRANTPGEGYRVYSLSLSSRCLGTSGPRQGLPVVPSCDVRVSPLDDMFCLRLKTPLLGFKSQVLEFLQIPLLSFIYNPLQGDKAKRPS